MIEMLVNSEAKSPVCGEASVPLIVYWFLPDRTFPTRICWFWTVTDLPVSSLLQSLDIICLEQNLNGKPHLTIN